jgi:hypothetical protein
MALNNNRTWTEYYEQEGGNIPAMLQFTNNNELKHFDLMTLGMTNDPAALLGATSTYPYNWMIVAGPTTQGRVNIIHHAFSVAESTNDDPKIVGVMGDRKTSALKPFDPAGATRTLNPKRRSPVPDRTRRFLPSNSS